MTDIEYPEIGSLEEATKAVRKIVNDLFRRNLLPNASPALVEAKDQIEQARMRQVMAEKMAGIDLLQTRICVLECQAQEYQEFAKGTHERLSVAEGLIKTLQTKVRKQATAPVALARKRVQPRAKRRGKHGTAR